MYEKSLDYKSYPILYVDDEKENLEAFADEFDQYFSIVLANSGSQALKIIEKEPVSMVLADQRMPQMSGVEVLEEINRRDPRIIRILITAYADIAVVIEAINKGNVYRYIKKPWEHEDVRTGVMRGLEHYHTEREREQLQAERIQNMRKMIRSNRLAAVGTMVSGLVHEIRNPMVAIQTFLQLLPRKIDDKEFVSRYLVIAKGEADRIEHLLENMLSFARPTRPVLRPCNLNELVERIVQLLEFQARRKNIQIQVSIDEKIRPAFADPSQIMQVIQNLGMNAIQAMGHTGTLYLRTFSVQRGTGDEYAGLEVRDTGPGIDRETMEKIFDPFFTTKAEGTGLGLSIAYQIINEHNGILEVESEPEKGATFHVFLPVSGQDHKKEHGDPYAEKGEAQAQS
jgi:signal transduction histidine kinase